MGIFQHGILFERLYLLVITTVWWRDRDKSVSNIVALVRCKNKKKQQMCLKAKWFAYYPSQDRKNHFVRTLPHNNLSSSYHSFYMNVCLLHQYRVCQRS